MGNLWSGFNKPGYQHPTRDISYTANKYPYITISIPESITDYPYVIYNYQIYTLTCSEDYYINNIGTEGKLNISYNHHIIVQNNIDKSKTKSYNYYNYAAAIRSAKLFQQANPTDIQIFYVKTTILNINGYNYKVASIKMNLCNLN